MDLPDAAAPSRPRPRFAMVALAVAGWSVFAIEWAIVLTMLSQSADTTNAVTYVEAAAPAAAVSNPKPTPKPTTTATTPRPSTPKPAATTTSKPATPKPAPAATATATNPFQLRSANVMGIDLPAGHTVVLLDAIEKSQAWFDDGKAALIAGLTETARGSQVGISYIRDGQAGSMSKSPINPGTSASSSLLSFLNPLKPEGSRGFWQGFDEAISHSPDQIVFVTSRTSGWASVIPSFEKRLQANGKRIRLHVVQVGPAVPELRAFVTGANGGQYKQFTADQLKKWRQAAQ